MTIGYIGIYSNRLLSQYYNYMLLRKNTSFHVSIYSIHKQLENMSKSPFYKTGISKSPLFKAGEYADTKRKQAVRKGQKRLTGEEAEEAMSPVKMNEGDISKKRRARRGERVRRLEKKLESLHEQVPIEGVNEFDLPSTPKPGVSERKINRINKRIQTRS